MFDSNKNFARNVVTFSKQMYNHDMRFLLVVAAIFVYFFIDALKWCVKLNGQYLFVVIIAAIPALPLLAILVYYAAYPFAHPVYKQYLKYFDDIQRGTVVIDLAFAGEKIGILRGSTHIRGEWCVEVSPFFSKLTKTCEQPFPDK